MAREEENEGPKQRSSDGRSHVALLGCRVCNSLGASLDVTTPPPDRHQDRWQQKQNDIDNTPPKESAPFDTSAAAEEITDREEQWPQDPRGDGQ